MTLSIGSIGRYTTWVQSKVTWRANQSLIDQSIRPVAGGSYCLVPVVGGT